MKRALRYAVVRAAIGMVGALPIRLAGRIGGWFGATAFHLARRERRWALEHLARAFPQQSDAERRALARRCFRHLGRSAFELCCVRQMDRALDAWIDFPAEDRAVLERALKAGKGVVFVSGHVGNWELMGRTLGLNGYPTHTIAKESPDPRLTRLMARFREEGRIHVIWRGRDGAAKEMLRALRDGHILGLIIDQDTRVQSVFVPFFGHPASTPRAAADLALRCGAAVVVGFCRRQPDGRYRVNVEPVQPPIPERTEAAAVALTARLTESIERAIREVPEQWVWMHRRWKTKP
ncbi:MAG TPA: lysophospholipid acyltransferase family protein [Myxococcaceae bacterium]